MVCAFYFVNKRMRSKRDIKMGLLCTRGREAVLRIVGGGVTFFFSNGDSIPDENMPFFIRLYALVVPLKTIPDFRLFGFVKKRSLWGSPTYS